jgi:hypothetical protein
MLAAQEERDQPTISEGLASSAASFSWHTCASRFGARLDASFCCIVIPPPSSSAIRLSFTNQLPTLICLRTLLRRPPTSISVSVLPPLCPISVSPSSAVQSVPDTRPTACHQLHRSSSKPAPIKLQPSSNQAPNLAQYGSSCPGPNRQGGRRS